MIYFSPFPTECISNNLLIYIFDVFLFCHILSDCLSVFLIQIYTDTEYCEIHTFVFYIVIFIDLNIKYLMMTFFEVGVQEPGDIDRM